LNRSRPRHLARCELILRPVIPHFIRAYLTVARSRTERGTPHKSRNSLRPSTRAVSKTRSSRMSISQVVGFRCCHRQTRALRDVPSRCSRSRILTRDSDARDDDKRGRPDREAFADGVWEVAVAVIDVDLRQLEPRSIDVVRRRSVQVPYGSAPGHSFGGSSASAPGRSSAGSGSRSYAARRLLTS